MAKNIDDTIIALLLEEPRYYSELRKEIVNVKMLCSNQTLVKHLKDLEDEGRIKRTVLSNTRVRYESLHSEEGEKLHDHYIFENLISNLHSSIIDSQLNLVEVKTKPSVNTPWENAYQDAIRILRHPIQNVPKLRFTLQCDEELTKKIALFTQLEEISTGFKNQINSNFSELARNIPPSINDDGFYKEITSFESIQTLSRSVANKYNFRFLLYSWFDGKGYANKILSALNKLQSLKKGHEDDILFLDEICNRYYYAWNEYDVEIDIIQELIIPKILDGCSINSLLEDAFWVYNGNRYDLCALESVLVSDLLCVDENIPTIDIIFDTKEKVPYKIIKMTDYMKLKLDLLNNNDKKTILKNLLSNLLSDIENHDNLQFIPTDKIDSFYKNLKYLMEELEVLYPQKDADKLQNDPIFNFKFILNGQIHDFTNTPLTQVFTKFLKDPSKKKWLQKCLETGVPIYSIIPFDKLGFTYSPIL